MRKKNEEEEARTHIHTSTHAHIYTQEATLGTHLQVLEEDAISRPIHLRK